MVFKANLVLKIIFVFSSSIIQIMTVSGTEHVTCGSVLKLVNPDYQVRLHSHDIKYGSGSGQQSVTGTDVKEDGNSYWLVKAQSGQHGNRGEPIKCQDTIRLEHMATRKNLHSHLVSSPLSRKQEVSAYGDHRGDGDSGDNWIIKCSTKYWNRGENVMFKHVDTDKYLTVSSKVYGNPINGQHEIVGEQFSKGLAINWHSMEGMFIHPNSQENSENHHDEL